MSQGAKVRWEAVQAYVSKPDEGLLGRRLAKERRCTRTSWSGS